jgi:hypothetical protein
MMSDPDFNLRFVEGLREEEPRRCRRVKRMTFGSHDDGLLVRVDPSYSGRYYGLSQVNIHFLLLSPKYQGDSLFPVSEWPEHVSVFLPLIDAPDLQDSLALNEVRKIAFGTIDLDGGDAWPAKDVRLTRPD